MHVTMQISACCFAGKCMLSCKQVHVVKQVCARCHAGKCMLSCSSLYFIKQISVTVYSIISFMFLPNHKVFSQIKKEGSSLFLCLTRPMWTHLSLRSMYDTKAFLNYSLEVFPRNSRHPFLNSQEVIIKPANSFFFAWKE